MPSCRREVVTHLRQAFCVSERGACRATGVVSEFVTSHVSDDPVTQCLVWGAGAAVGSGWSRLATVITSVK